MTLKCNVVRRGVLYKILFYNILFAILFLIFPALGNGLEAKEADSLAFFDKQLSFQSDLPMQERVAITRKAEKYATKKGDVYKSCTYVARRGNLYYFADESDSCLSVYRKLIPQLEKYVEKTGEERWKILLAESYTDVALSLMYKGKSDSAMLICQNLLLRFEKDSIPQINAKCASGIGVIFAYRKLYNSAEKHMLTALSIYDKLKDARGLFIANSNLAALFQSQGLQEEALPYGFRAYRIAQTENYNGQERIFASLVLGSIYLELIRCDVALPYFEEAVKLSQEKQFSHLNGFAEVSYARNLYCLGQYTQARKVAEKALRECREKQKYELQVDLLKILSDITEAQKDMPAAMRYMREYIDAYDTLLDTENMRQLIEIQFRYDDYRREQEARNSLNELKLAKANAQNRVLWIIVLLISLGLLLVAVIFMWRRMRMLRMAEELTKEESRRQIQTAEQQIEVKNKELATNALQFLRLNNLQESILKELKHLKTAFTLRGKEKRVVCEIEELVQQIASEREWKDFQFYFDQVDKEFFRQLSERFPDLTANEKHLCVLFKLGLTNKDVASLTGRSLQSVGMAKFRLRSKLKLENQQDLAQFLNSL